MRHWENINRLLQGKESKLGGGRKAEAVAPARPGKKAR
jgi:hypothetical protein